MAEKESNNKKEAKADSVIAEYAVLKKQHGLPDFEIVDKEFELRGINDSLFLLRRIRERISERAEDFIKILENVLQPNTNINDLYECKFFTDADKIDVFEFYKRLMLLTRTALELDVLQDDVKDAEFIRDCVKDWPAFKKSMHDVANKMKVCWQKDVSYKNNAEYFG